MENNWTIAQTKQLFELAKKAYDSKKGLVWAFSQVAKSTNRSVNSVRNFYYSQLKMFELVPKLADELGVQLITETREDFKLFTQNEIEKLVRDILIGKAEGKSVRAVIAELSKGDLKLALRYQNKYRSMVAHHRDKVNRIMKDLAEKNIVFFNPYTKKTGQALEEDNFTRLSSYLSTMNESEVQSFVTLLKKLV